MDNETGITVALHGTCRREQSLSTMSKQGEWNYLATVDADCGIFTKKSLVVLSCRGETDLSTIHRLLEYHVMLNKTICFVDSPLFGCKHYCFVGLYVQVSSCPAVILIVCLAKSLKFVSSIPDQTATNRDLFLFYASFFVVRGPAWKMIIQTYF